MRSLDLDFPDFQPTLPLTPAVQERYHAVQDALRESDQQARQARIAMQRDSYAAQLREFQRMALERDAPPSIAEINQAILDLANHGYTVAWGRIEHRISDPDP